jgi:hypothetical protein
MQTIRYATGQLALGLIAGFPMFFLGLYLLSVGHGKLAFCGGILALLGPVLVLGSAKLLLGDHVALRFDDQRVFIATMWRKRELRWSEVTEINVATVSTYAFFGLIKTSSGASLQIAAKAGLFGAKKFSLSEGLLKLDSSGLLGLVAQLERARSGAQVIGSAVAADPPARDTRHTYPLDDNRPADGFDADAIMARYLGNRSTVVGEAPRSAPRLNGISLEPARPAFGRKIA